jgi:hypothetical protein
MEAVAELARLSVTDEFRFLDDVALGELRDALASRADSVDEAHAVVTHWIERNRKCMAVVDIIETLAEIRAGKPALPKYGRCSICGGTGYIVWDDAQGYSHGRRCSCAPPPPPATPAERKATK